MCTMGNEGLAGTVDIKTGNWGLVREALTAGSTGPPYLIMGHRRRF